MKSLHNLVDGTTRQSIQQNRQIRQLISRIVPASTLSHIQFCRLDAGRLRLTVDSANWIARLRFSERQIIGVLREAGFDAITLSCHVAPVQIAMHSGQRSQQRAPSIKAANTLERLADDITREAADKERRIERGALAEGSSSRNNNQAASGATSIGKNIPSHFTPQSEEQIAGRIAETSDHDEKVRLPVSTARLRTELLRLAAQLRGKD